jgi:hypothetical protein
MLGILGQDLRYGLRMLRKDPGLSRSRGAWVARSERGGAFMMRSSLLTLTIGGFLLLPAATWGQDKAYPLETRDGLTLHSVAAEPVTHEGRKGLRVMISKDVLGRMEGMTPEQRARLEQLAVIDGSDFSSGVIEAEIAGAPAPGAAAGARGFVGIAFRVQKDLQTYDAFYLRPTNGRAEDQERRNHAAQYIAHPQWPWFRLRKETPSRYESYVDLVPGVWTKVKIEVDGASARLYVHDQEQPTLIVNDVKSGADARGAIALWIDVGTVAHFRNLVVRPLPAK